LLDQQFRELFESTSDAIVVVGEDQWIVVVNEQVEAIFGYSGAEMTSRPLVMLLPSRFRTRHRVHCKGFVEGDGARQLMSARRELVAMPKWGRVSR
jgi:PAS domain S-box-containing protein